MKFMKCFWMYHSLFLIWNWQMIEVASPSWWRQTHKAPEQIQSFRAFACQCTKMLLGKYSQYILQRSSMYFRIVRIAIILNSSKSLYVLPVFNSFYLCLPYMIVRAQALRSMWPWPWSSLATSAMIRSRDPTESKGSLGSKRVFHLGIVLRILGEILPGQGENDWKRMNSQTSRRALSMYHLRDIAAICSWVAGSLTGNWGRHPGKNDGVVVALAEIELLRIVQDDSMTQNTGTASMSKYPAPCPVSNIWTSKRLRFQQSAALNNSPRLKKSLPSTWKQETQESPCKWESLSSYLSIIQPVQVYIELSDRSFWWVIHGDTTDSSCLRRLRTPPRQSTFHRRDLSSCSKGVIDFFSLLAAVQETLHIFTL